MRLLIFFFAFLSVLNAHFLALLPTTDVVESKKDSILEIKAMFIHPFEQSGMDLEKLDGLFVNGEPLEQKEFKNFGHRAFKADFKVDKPGLYTFYATPKYYFEPLEDLFLRHYPKVIVSGYGIEDGWDEPVGLPYEIVPLVKPFGIYAGNLFQGRVLQNGKVVPNTLVEVEFYNDLGASAPTNAHITQSVMSDDFGVFSFVPIHKGWWGFTAIIMDGEKELNGKKYEVENGATIWIKAY
ncbi:MAG: DUF4198 domain-containing protein [Campylobacterales bacterium]|nr:DUF4198 domain-containing protein [Campylobacterales bacterium]